MLKMFGAIHTLALTRKETQYNLPSILIHVLPSRTLSIYPQISPHGGKQSPFNIYCKDRKPRSEDSSSPISIPVFDAFISQKPWATTDHIKTILSVIGRDGHSYN